MGAIRVPFAASTVHGAATSRVLSSSVPIDAAVMRAITSANTAAPTIMIAERDADAILA
jgi:choline dehydrogenase-like flavoprotein